MTTVNDALSELLDAEGFAAMARDVRTEQDPRRLDHYARIIYKNAPAAIREEVGPRLRSLGFHVGPAGYRTLPEPA